MNDDRSSLSVPSRQSADADISVSGNPAQKQAAANIVRGQIDTIYQNDPHTTGAAPSTPTPSAAPVTSKTTNQSTHGYARPTGTVAQTQVTPQQRIAPGPGAVNTHEENPYNRTLSQDSPLKTKDNSWQKYHSAWQSYYQQYYERYYISQVAAAKKSLNDQAEVHRTAAEKLRAVENTEALTPNEAIDDLRGSLRKKIRKRAAKVRKSRHFVPIMAALGVLLVFLFLQYNRVLFAYVEAYIAPGAMDPESIIVSSNAETPVSADPKLIIPKIAVDEPIVWDADASSQDSLNAAMTRGVVWFNMQGANARPGERGNFVVSGHSANDWLDSGNHKFVFARLERMAAGDVVYVNYNSKRYTYKITRTQVVKPTDVSALQIGSDKPYITLITCVPLGTALNRLLVFGEQISPSPDEAAASTETAKPAAKTNSAKKMPANSPTFIERLFGVGAR